MTSTGWSAEEAGNDLVDGYGAVHVEQGIAEKMLRFNHRAMDKLGEKSGMACMRLITTVQDMVSAFCATIPGSYQQIGRG